MAENQIKAFRRGMARFDQEIAAIKDRRNALRSEIMAVLGIKNKVSFVRYADGRATLDITKHQAIEKLFEKYGISAPWGFPPEEDSEVN